MFEYCHAVTSAFTSVVMFQRGFVVGKLTFADLDERAFEALKEFPTEGALAVLNQFVESNLDHVSNKSAYLCGMMKTYRQKQKTSVTNAAPNMPKGPDEEKIKVIMSSHCSL